MEFDEIYQFWVKKVPKNFEIPIVYRTIGQKIAQTKCFFYWTIKNFLDFDYFDVFSILEPFEWPKTANWIVKKVAEKVIFAYCLFKD